MKKKIFSVLGILILGLNTVFCNAVEISFEALDSQNGEFYIDDEYTQESFQEEENILVTSNSDSQESSHKATENNYIDKNFSRINLLNSDNDENILENLSVPANLDYTIVDLTNLATGDIISHDCNLYLISNFDENEHWNECSVCGKILNLEEHNYVDNGWTGGSANLCITSNVHLFSCECGSNYTTAEGRKAHSPKTMAQPNSYQYMDVCNGCDCVLKIHHDCVKSDGSRINCSNLGKCSLCGYTYSSALHQSNNQRETGPVYCPSCNKYLGNINAMNIVYNSDGTITVNYNISISGSYTSLSNSANTTSTATYSFLKTGINPSVKVTLTGHPEAAFYLVTVDSYYISGVRHKIVAMPIIYPEIQPPVITNIVSNEGKWTTDTSINISGTENYCSSVSLTLKDANTNFFLKNIKTSVTNKNWNYEINPDIESSENTEFILEVKDSIGNTTEQIFYISKVDARPPQMISDSEIFNTEWSKSKDYIVISSDYGIGQVHNSVINTDSYEPTTEDENIFYKGYTFTGDVYGETFVPIYMKDGLNNQNVEFVKVSNLDNTPPNIESIEYNKTLHNTEITISANDINEKLNASGSGVTGYAISTENEIPDIFQEENTFNLIKSGKYYLFVTDAVGNITFKELNIPVQYKVTINPNGGTWKGDSNPKEYIADNENPINLYPEPEKEGYTFKEWKITGEGEITPEGELIIGGDVQVTPIWEVNTYSVIYIDYNVTKKEELKRVIKDLNYNTLANGFDIGSDTSDNAYYPQYRLISSTETVVSTNPENNVVYRYFEFCYTSKESHINFNDNNNADGLRPDTYTLQLILENGELIDEVTLPTTEPDYTFTNLPKYNPQGEEYKYKIVPIISDRYTPEEPNENGNTTITYHNPECSISIPKTTTLDGKDGDLTYTIQITSNLFYKDKIIIIPEEYVTLTDGVKNMVATIKQDKTEFNKDDISNNSLRITGQIQTTRKHFAGTWHGTFNFKIKYEVKN